MPSRTASVAARGVVPVVACTAALLIKWALGPQIVPSVFLTFYGAVLVSAWYTGLSGGLIAAGLSAVIGTVLYLPPVYPPQGAGAITDVRLLLFLVIAVGISWTTHRIRRARDELRVRVEERTAALSEANASLRVQ